MAVLGIINDHFPKEPKIINPTFRTFLASAGANGDNSFGVPTALFI
jgi:hypothetical protein